MRQVIALVFALAASSCKTDKAPPPRLITEAEIAAHEKALLARLAANQTRKCERLPLRGEAASGPAAADALAVIEPAAGTPLAACHAKLTPDAPAPAVVAECGPVFEAAIAKAVAHVDACSPYQAGVRASADMPGPQIKIAKLVDAYAAERAKTDPPGAMWITLEAMQWSDDLARGHTSLLDNMIAIANVQILAKRAAAIAPTLPADALPALATAVDVLLAEQPSMTETFRGELETMTLFYALAPLEPAGWVPPGGWGMHAVNDVLTPAQDGMDRRDGYAIMFYVTDRQAAEIERVCPDDVTLEMCAIGLASVPTGREDANVEKRYKELLAAKNPSEVRLKIRDAIANVLTDVARPAYADYVKKRGRAVALLAALRIHLGRTCTVDPALLAPKHLGGKLVATQVDKRLELAPPAWLGGDPLPTFNCP